MTVEEFVIKLSEDYEAELKGVIATVPSDKITHKKAANKLKEIHGTRNSDPQLRFVFKGVSRIRGEQVLGMKRGKFAIMGANNNGRTVPQLFDAVYFDTDSGRYVYIIPKHRVSKASEQMFSNTGLDAV